MWLIMKLSSIFCFLLVLNVSATAYSQQNKVSLNLNDVSMEEFIDAVRQQTGVNFLYNASIFTGTGRVSVKVKKETLDKVLKNTLEQQGLIFDYQNGVVVIKKKDTVDYLPQHNVKTVSGIVKDADGIPLPGVSVIVKGTQTGVATNLDGYFEIKVADDPALILQFSFVGMKPKELKIGNNHELDVVLENVAENLGEVIVTGYQTLSKERATGAYGIINTQNIETKLQSNLNSVLEGQATGVVLDKNGKIEIRGVSTFNAEKSPLIVVDGYPIDGGLENLNPDNIENITVLKDGVAASIYGSRAANGVIVVTTTKGKIDTFNVSYKGIVSTILKPQLSALNRASASDYIDAELDIFRQNPNAPSTMDRRGMGRVTWLMMQVREGNMDEKVAMDEINELRKVDGLKQAEKYFFRNQLSHQHNIAVNGGTEKNQFNAAINYLDNRSSMIHSGNSRLIFDVKNDWSPTKFISLGLTASVVYRKNNRPVQDWSDLLEYSSASYIQPYDNLVDPKTGKPTAVFSTPPYKIGNYEIIPGMKDWTYNPIEDLGKETVKTEDMQTRIGGKLRINIVEGVNIETGGVWTRGNRVEKTTYNQDSYTMRIAYNDATSKDNHANHYIPDGAWVDEWRNTNESWTIRTQINLNRTLQGEKHRVSVLLGNEVRQRKYDNNQLASRVGFNPIAGSFIPINIKDYNMGLYDSDMLFGRRYMISRFKTGSYDFRDVRFVSWYGNASYEYNNRYLLSGSVRLDLTNFFGTDPEYRYKPLWSVGGTWKVSEENFFDVSWINRWHLRASYGINGNISLDEGPFMILSVGSFSDMTQGVSYGVASPPNNQLRWEKTQTTNIGTDLTLFGNRINLTLDYYLKYSTDLLASDAIDPTTGFSSVTRNAGKMTNRGIEFSINADVVRYKDFLWNTTFNISYNKNLVKEYNVTRSYASSYTGPPIQVAGYAADGLFGYRYAGLDNNGQALGYTEDGEKKLLASLKPEDIVCLGSVRPKYDLSFTNVFKYKDMQLSFMFIAKLGHKYRKDGFYGTNYQNRHVAERWKEPGDEKTKKYPVLQGGSSDSFYFPYTDFLIGKASYMKLRDVTLSYSLPHQWIQTIGMTQTRVYFQARNLWTVTAQGVDIDPEISEYNPIKSVSDFTEQGFTSLPLRPEFYFGLSFSF